MSDSKIDSRLRSVRHVSAAGFEIRHGPIDGSDRLLFQIWSEFIPKFECSPSSRRMQSRNRFDPQSLETRKAIVTRRCKRGATINIFNFSIIRPVICASLNLVRLTFRFYISANKYMYI